MEKRWVVKKEPGSGVITKLIEDLGVSRPLAVILGQRGIDTYEKARTFFRPDLANLYDPFRMKGMEEAVNRIEKAVASNENILIYGDYDVDGTTAVALVYSYLTRDYPRIGYYIPDRYKEGYGISNAGVDFAIDNSFDLVIALDCGIKAIHEIGKGKENGVDFIICDHHTPGEELPEAIILNPKQDECTYPFKELSGCGIGFKLVQALNHIRGGQLDDIKDLLDLVVVSIGADIVSMSDENRILAYHGITNGSLADFLKIPAGGTRTLNYGESCNSFLCVDNPQELDRIFSELYLKNYQLTVKASVEKSGYRLEDVTILLTNQVKKSLAREILAALGFTEDQTVTTLPEFGHLGPMDTLLGLALCIEKDKVSCGDIVVLASSAAGFSWGALTLQWH